MKIILAAQFLCLFLDLAASQPQAKRPNLASLAQSSSGTKCATKDGQNGECLPSFECPLYADGNDEIEKTVCKSSFFVLFYCCPKNNEMSTNPGINKPRNPSPATIILEPATSDTDHAKFPVSLSQSNPLDKLRIANCGERWNNFHPRIQRSAFAELPSSIGTKSPLIVGGNIAKKNSWPWMAAIYSKNRGITSFLCGGTIISDRYILTAAHCFKTNRNSRVSAGRFVIRLAEYDLEDTNKGEEYSIEDIIVHEGHQPPNDYNDIALMKVKRRIIFSEKVQPICLPVEDAQENFDSQISTVIGWGVTNFAGRESNLLQEVSIPITTKESCKNSYKRFIRDYPDGIIDSQICAGLETGGKDSCQGDSGGPLMLKTQNNKWTLIGIVSGGFQCAKPQYPGVYTRVTSYLPWIAQHYS